MNMTQTFGNVLKTIDLFLHVSEALLRLKSFNSISKHLFCCHASHSAMLANKFLSHDLQPWITKCLKLTSKINSCLGDSQVIIKLICSPWKDAPWGRIVLLVWWFSSTFRTYTSAIHSRRSIFINLMDLQNTNGNHLLIWETPKRNCAKWKISLILPVPWKMLDLVYYGIRYSKHAIHYPIRCTCNKNEIL